MTDNNWFTIFVSRMDPNASGQWAGGGVKVLQGDTSGWVLYFVHPACGPLLQLATAQAGQGNSPNWCQRNIGLNLTCHPVGMGDYQNLNIWKAHSRSFIYPVSEMISPRPGRWTPWWPGWWCRGWCRWCWRCPWGWLRTAARCPGGWWRSRP